MEVDPKCLNGIELLDSRRGLLAYKRFMNQ